MVLLLKSAQMCVTTILQGLLIDRLLQIHTAFLIPHNADLCYDDRTGSNNILKDQARAMRCHE